MSGRHPDRLSPREWRRVFGGGGSVLMMAFIAACLIVGIAALLAGDIPGLKSAPSRIATLAGPLLPPGSKTGPVPLPSPHLPGAGPTIPGASPSPAPGAQPVSRAGTSPAAASPLPGGSRPGSTQVEETTLAVTSPGSGRSSPALPSPPRSSSPTAPPPGPPPHSPPPTRVPAPAACLISVSATIGPAGLGLSAGCRSQ